MTVENDIITRMRSVDFNCDYCQTWEACLEAADEIELWRKIADDLAYLYRHTVGLEGAYAPALMAYERAKNG